MNDTESTTYTVARDQLVAVLDELPDDTRARMKAVLAEMRYDRIVLNREGHAAPWNVTAFDVRRVETAINRLESK